MKIKLTPYKPGSFHEIRDQIRNAESLEKALDILAKQKINFELFVALVQKFPVALQLVQDENLKSKLMKSVKGLGVYSDIKRNNPFSTPRLQVAATKIQTALGEIAHQYHS